MSLWRKNARVDDNAKEITATFRAHGASVLRISAPGAPDLCVGWVSRDGTRRTELVEVKRPLGVRGGSSHSALNEAQRAFRESWKGSVPWVVRSPLEVLALLGYYDEEAG